MNVLVTGAAGYIGSQLTRKLLDLGYNVTAYDNLLYRQISLIDLCHRDEFEFIHGDVRHTDKLLPYIKKADVIIPLAAYVGFPLCERERELSTQVNFDQIDFIVKNTSKNQRIIFPCTNSGYGIGQDGIYCTEETPLNPVSRYGIDKTRAESVLLGSGRAVSLRLATVFGVSPRMRTDLLVNDFTYKAVHDGYIVIFEKNFKRNFIHVQDVVDAFILMLEKYDNTVGQAFNVGLSEANLSKLELAEKIKTHVPDFVIEVNDFKSDPDKRNYIVSNAKIEALGWKAKRDLDFGIKELIKAYRILIHNSRKYTNL